MTGKKWKLVVNPLSGSAPIHQFEIEAPNWMGALRGARKHLGEEGGLPSGASCAVTPDGTVTILDPEARRRFVLSPIAIPAESAVMPPADPKLLPDANQRGVKPAKFKTIAYAPAQPLSPPASSSVAGPASPASPANQANVRPANAAAAGSVGTAGQANVRPAPANAAPPASVGQANLHASAPANAAGRANVRPASANAAGPPGGAKPAGAASSASEAGLRPAPKPSSVRPTAGPQPSAARAMAAKHARQASQSIPAPAPAGAKPSSAKLPQAPLERAPPKSALNAQLPPRHVDPPDQNSGAAPTTSAGAASIAPGARTKMHLELMLSRDVEPGPENPLTYRERAYLIPKGMSVSEAEAALRFALAEMQQQFGPTPKGKFVNLAAFDHNWIDRPSRPPLVSLEWRDWRGEPSVDYPSAASSIPPNATESDERLAAVFEALHELAHLKTAAEGLDFCVRLLTHVVPCEALSGCLYDINTDELRLVAVQGMSSDSAQGKAIPRGAGLFGKAAQLEHAALVIPDLKVEQAYEPAREGRLGLNATNMLLRPLTHEGRLLGMLQLINRTTGGFSTSDVHLVNYLAERLSEFLRDARARIRH